MDFSVSVIIPVYNAAAFIEKAVSSALQQIRVEEVIVVNDGSSDNSLQILEQFQKKDSRIKIYHHENQVNKGRSASRNLGIQKATGNFIAFLDADDFYLENRFENDMKEFQDKKEIDAIYNAIGAHFYRETTKIEQDELKLTTVTEKIKPDLLFENLLSGGKGYFSIDGLTVKKTVFEKTGYFVENLVVAEDTELILKMALKCQLQAGIIDKPLAMRGVHDSNVFNQSDMYSIHRLKMYESLIRWTIKEQLPSQKTDKLLEWLWYYRDKDKQSLATEIRYWSHLVSQSPKLLFSVLGYKYFPIIRQRKKLFPILFR